MLSGLKRTLEQRTYVCTCTYRQSRGRLEYDLAIRQRNPTLLPSSGRDSYRKRWKQGAAIGRTLTRRQRARARIRVPFPGQRDGGLLVRSLSDPSRGLPLWQRWRRTLQGAGWLGAWQHGQWRGIARSALTGVGELSDDADDMHARRDIRFADLGTQLSRGDGWDMYVLSYRWLQLRRSHRYTYIDLQSCMCGSTAM